VPLLDADWNEQEDLRRIELEAVLAQAIGSGVPAGSNGFRVREASTNDNNFFIEAGLIFIEGWLVYNPSGVDYINQPHRNKSGLSPDLPIPLASAPVARRELVYLDAWERPVNKQEDEKLIDPDIGVETCLRLERAWVVRMEPIANDADPLDSATLPNRQSGHRYYPMATVDRPPGGRISNGMINDLRRTHLTLEALTHAPLLIDDPVRGQRLDSARLVLAFHGNLDAMQDLLHRSPEIFIYSGHETETWQAMTAYQDVRASAMSFEQQAMSGLLHRQAARQAMNSFYQVQSRLNDLLQQFVDDGIAPSATADFLQIYRTHLQGTSSSDTQSLAFALAADDLLGAVMAQERLNQELAQESDTLPEGTVTANLISITPSGPLAPNTVQPQYLLTIRIQSNLTSVQGSEPIRAIVSAGVGWNLSFQGSTEIDLREIVVTIPNQNSQDVVLIISAEAGAADTTLSLSVRPERRQQLAYNHPPVTLALGQEVLPGPGVIASLNYQGPPLQPGNVAPVARSVMSGGVQLPFGVTNLSTGSEQFQLTVTAQGDDTGWQAPNQPILSSLAPSGSRNVDITFQTTDEAGATSPLTYRLRLVRVTGSVSEPLTYTTFDITFDLQ
jgi:hypothetical protein